MNPRARRTVVVVTAGVFASAVLLAAGFGVGYSVTTLGIRVWSRRQQ